MFIKSSTTVKVLRIKSCQYFVDDDICVTSIETPIHFMTLGNDTRLNLYLLRDIECFVHFTSVFH